MFYVKPHGFVTLLPHNDANVTNTKPPAISVQLQILISQFSNLILMLIVRKRVPFLLPVLF